MKEINFIAGGMMGDFIHCLSVVKNICEKENARANIYLTDNPHYGGDKWKYGAEKAYMDLYALANSQPLIQNLKILNGMLSEDHINLNTWRGPIVQLFYKNGYYSQSWSEFLSLNYSYEIPGVYKWLNITEMDKTCENKVIIHRSEHRHNENFQWQTLLDNITDELIFLTNNPSEYEGFIRKYKCNASLKVYSSVYELATCINGCKYFIGNQSMPFALACALDKPRLVELDKDAHAFYINEEKYSKNISWYFNDNQKYISQNLFPKL